MIFIFNENKCILLNLQKTEWSVQLALSAQVDQNI